MGLETHKVFSPQGIQSLRDLLKKKVSDLVFLKKTKVNANYLLSRHFSFGFHNRLVVDNDVRSRRLAMFWKEEVNFEVIQYFKHHIHGKILLGMSEGHFWLTG